MHMTMYVYVCHTLTNDAESSCYMALHVCVQMSTSQICVHAHDHVCDE